MASPAAGTGGFSVIMARTFGALRADFVFYVGVLVAYWALLAGAGFAVKAISNPTAPAMVTAGIGLGQFVLGVLMVSVVRAVTNHRLAREAAGGSPQPDIQGGLGLIVDMIIVSFVITAGAMINLAITFIPGINPLLAGLLGFVGGIVQIILFLLFGAAPPALMDRRKGVADALAESRKLTKGHRWLLFGVAFVIGLVFGLATLPVILGKMSLAAGGGGAAAMAASMTPLETIYLGFINAASLVTTTIAFWFYYATLKRGAGQPGAADVFS